MAWTEVLNSKEIQHWQWDADVPMNANWDSDIIPLKLGLKRLFFYNLIDGGSDAGGNDFSMQFHMYATMAAGQVFFDYLRAWDRDGIYVTLGDGELDSTGRPGWELLWTNSSNGGTRGNLCPPIIDGLHLDYNAGTFTGTKKMTDIQIIAMYGAQHC